MQSINTSRLSSHYACLCIGLLAIAAFSSAVADSAAIDVQLEKIKVHAGAKNGAYAALVDQINIRAADLRNTCGPTPLETCPVSRFEFESACDDGGSIANLQRLGLPRRNSAKPIQKQLGGYFRRLFSSDSNNGIADAGCEKDSPGKKRGFALVQNFFVYGAAAKNCQGSASEQCKSRAANEDLTDFDYFEDLRAVLPISYGRIQIVAAKRLDGTQDVEKLKDLAGRPVYLGSGVNAVHGKEVFNRHPLIARSLDANIISRETAITELASKVGIPEGEIPKGQRALGNLLVACNIVSAYVISGEVIKEEKVPLGAPYADSCQPVELKQVPIPDVIINGMTSEFPYYQRVASPPALQDSGFDDDMPAVTTYLVSTSSTSVDTVKRLTSALQADWRNLMLLNDDLVPLEENIYKQPAPLHRGAQIALQEAGLLGKDYLPWWLAMLGVITLFAVFWKTEIRYDRLGESHTISSSRHLTRMALILFGTVMFFLLIVKLIRQFEGIQAADQGTNNPIARKGFEEVLLWMFTFVSSGYENNVFPSSPYSVLVVGLFAIIGIALPIWAIVKVIDHMREAKLARERGGESRSWLRRKKDQLAETFNLGYRSKGVLLLCGWNNKAPGLIYTLTCPDSPYPGMVNIIADMDVEYPIQHYHFNKQRVRFYRGDASHRSTLERADGLQADNALILADFNAETKSNTAGILTALAIKKLQEKRNGTSLHVSAEMTLKKDDLRFLKAHVNNIVDPELIAQRVIAAACFSRHVLSFVLDALSPDERSEWYSIDIDLIRRRFLDNSTTLKVADFRHALLQREILLVGFCRDQQFDVSSDFSPDFKKNLNLDPLTDYEDLQKDLPAACHLICAAVNPKSFRRQRLPGISSRRHETSEATSESISIIPPLPPDATILVIGKRAAAGALKDYLNRSAGQITVDIVATDVASDVSLDEKIVDRVTGRAWTHAVLLSTLSESFDAAEYSRHSRHADSETILRANLIKTTLADAGRSAIIIAELQNAHSRRMAEDAGVTTVVSTSLVVERILARLVSGRGHVSEMLMAMLSMEDGTYLRSFELPADHPLVGRTFGDVLNTWFADGRVLGLLPHHARERYANEEEDFGTHFAMCPTESERGLRLAEQDVLIVLNKDSYRQI